LYKNDLQKREKAPEYAKTGVIFAIFFLCMADFSINAVLKGLALCFGQGKGQWAFKLSPASHDLC